MDKNSTKFPALYPILDADLVVRGVADAAARRDRLGKIVRELVQAGVEILQYRNKRDADAQVLEDARAMREAAGVMRIILNDRVALFDPLLWDGVHVGQDDLAPGKAREILGHNPILGLSTHNDGQVIAANGEPVDYIAIGPVFSTLSKSDTAPVIGPEGVRRARALTSKPVVAIGGITLANAASVYAAGAESLAVISAIFAVPGRAPAQCARDFLAIFK